MGRTATVGRLRERRQGAAGFGSAQARCGGLGAPPAAGPGEPRSVCAGGDGSGTCGSLQSALRRAELMAAVLGGHGPA